MNFQSVVTDDFNAPNSRQWKNGITNSAGLELDSLTSSAECTKMIDNPTYAINSLMSCIDLIRCINQIVISKHRVDVLILDKCHHDITYGKIDNLVPLLPIYVPEVLDYSKTNVEKVKVVISNFNQNKAFENLFINEKVGPKYFQKSYLP